MRLKPLFLVALVILFFAACKSETEPSKPNVLFIAVDDLNDWLGGFGGHPQAITPNIDRLISEGVSFRNAHTNCAACQPSRNSILSGLHPTSTGWYSNNWNGKDVRRTYDSLSTKSIALPQYFKDHGYVTMGAGKIYHSGVAEFDELIPDYWTEVDTSYKVSKEIIERGHGYAGSGHFYHPFAKGGSPIVEKFGKIPGFSLAGGPLDSEDVPEMGMHDAYIADWGVQKIGEQGEASFFLALGFVRPHVPFTAPREYFDLYNPKAITIPEVPDNDLQDVPMIGKAMAYGILPMGDHKTVLEMGPDYWRELTHAYLASISFMDAQVGKVLDALKRSGKDKNTIVILWSDHGQHIGEKKHWRKMALWEESTRIPLIIRLPDGPKSSSLLQPVSLLDVYPTLVELCGLPDNNRLQGQSLMPLIRDQSQKRSQPVVSCWFEGNYAVRDDRWRYILYSDGTEELYDHETDSMEWHNVASDPQFNDIKADLKRWIPTKVTPAFQDPNWAKDTPEQLAAEWEREGVPEWLE